MTADGAALGLNALGSTDEAGALGLMEFGPVAAGAEPGIGTYTPCALAPTVMAGGAARGAERARGGAGKRRSTAPARLSNASISPTRANPHRRIPKTQNENWCQPSGSLALGCAIRDGGACA